MPNPTYRLNRAELARLNRLIRIDSDTQCWEWIGQLSKNGYGRWQRGPGYTQQAAHRIVWQHFEDTLIPEGMQLDHLCRNRICCNPAHLEPVTPSENTMRQNHYERRKTHCPKGHEYNEENTRRTKQGKRVCRACDRERSRKIPATTVAGPDMGEPPHRGADVGAPD